VKIVDFGIAQTPVSNLTMEGRLLGSPRYLSPEMAAGLPIDHRADQFSLGTVLIEMLTGKQVFDGDTLYEVLGQVREAPTPPLKSMGAKVSRSLQKLVTRLHDKDASQRFAEEMELLEWLRDEARDLRLSLPPPSRH
jgi:serine/threonine-protein kinase